MKKFNFVIPIHGAINIEIIAEDVDEAFEILFNKKDAYEYHPNGHLVLEIENAITTISDEKITLN